MGTGGQWRWSWVDRTDALGRTGLRIDCPTVRVCVAVDAGLHGFLWTEGSWRGPVSVAPRSMNPTYNHVTRLSCAAHRSASPRLIRELRSSSTVRPGGDRGVIPGRIDRRARLSGRELPRDRRCRELGLRPITPRRSDRDLIRQFHWIRPCLLRRTDVLLRRRLQRTRRTLGRDRVDACHRLPHRLPPQIDRLSAGAVLRPPCRRRQRPGIRTHSRQRTVVRSRAVPTGLAALLVPDELHPHAVARGRPSNALRS